MADNWKIGDTLRHPEDKIDLKVVNTYKDPEGKPHVDVVLPCPDSDHGLLSSTSQERLETEGYQKKRSWTSFFSFSGKTRS